MTDDYTNPPPEAREHAMNVVANYLSLVRKRLNDYEIFTKTG